VRVSVTGSDHPLLEVVRSKNLHRELGLLHLEASAGSSTLQVRVPPGILNTYGKTHAALLYLFLDIACYVANLSLLPADRGATTVSSSFSFLRPTGCDDQIVFEGKVLKLGRTLAFGSAQARVADKIIAHALLTQALTQR
jgi:acyl-coenzyme A thioesterase PaaI-like protein